MSLPKSPPSRFAAILIAALLVPAAPAAGQPAAGQPAAGHPAAGQSTAGQPAAGTNEAASREDGVFFPETFTLSNGLQVVVVTNRRMPVVTHMMWYKVGAADEETGRSGIAHFLEHLMFKATDELEAGEFSRIVARNGGQDHAFTSWDYTAYYQNVARDRLELVMKMEADRMSDLALTDEVIVPEREVVLEERRQRTDNEPASRLAEQVNATLFVHHPYGRPIIGWASEIAGLDREDAEDFYRTWYAPNNAVLVVAGDVDAGDLRPLAEKYYGGTPARPVPERTRVEEPPLEAERRVILRDAEVRQPSLRKLFVAPSYNRGASELAYPLQVLSEILGGGSTSRLYRDVVVGQRLATSAGTGYSPTAYDLSVFGLYASPTPETSPGELENALDAVVRRVLEDGVTAEEVATAKQRLQRQAVFARDSLRGPAFSFGAALASGGTVEDVESWPSRIAAVTVEEVDAAARAVLDRPGPVVGLLLPAERQTAEVPATPPPPAAPPASPPAATPPEPAAGAGEPAGTGAPLDGEAR